jgi:predicted kinase
MLKPLLIIITGFSCTGKTTIGLKIAKEFSLPFINKDNIKERLFDSLGWKDREWSKKLSLASYEILYYFLDSSLEAGNSVIVESNFFPEDHDDNFHYLMKRYEFVPFQILCKTEGEILFERFKQRFEAGQRHPGHVDKESFDEMKLRLLKGRIEPLKIEGKLIEIDTTDFDKIDYYSIFKEIKKVLRL